MGLFGDFRLAGAQRDRLIDLKSEVTSSEAWGLLFDSVLWGSGVRIGFALVDCRRCGKGDSGLLLDQTVWDWQTHKISYANCLSDPFTWVAENQGPQAAKSPSEWGSATWSTFNEKSGSARKMQGEQVLSHRSFPTIADWIVEDFIEKSVSIKLTLADVIRKSGKPDFLAKLQKHIEIEGLDI